MKQVLTVSCLIATLVAGTSGTLLGPTFENLALRFEISLKDTGIFTFAQFIGITIMILVTGRLLDRVDARYTLVAGSVLTGSGLLLLVAAPSLPIAMLGALILGFGYGIIDIACNVVIAALNPKNTGAWLSLLAFFYGLGAVIGPQLVNFALAHDNFTLAYTGTAFLSLLLVIPFARTSLFIHDESQHRTNRAVQWAVLLPFAIMLFVYVGAEVGFSSWIVTQLSKVSLSLPPTATAGASLFWIGVTLSRGLSTYLLRHISEPLMLVVSILIIGVGTFILLLFAPIEGISLICAFVVGFGCGPVFPLAVSIAGNLYPDARGTATGVLIAAGTFGGAILPVIQGQIGAGQNGGMILVLALSVLLFVLVQIATRRAVSQQSVTA